MNKRSFQLQDNTDEDGYYDYCDNIKQPKISEVHEITTTSRKLLTFKDFKRDVETSNGNKELPDKDLTVIKDISTELSKSNSDARFDPKSVIHCSDVISVPIVFKTAINYKILKAIRVQSGTLFKSMLITFNPIAHEWKLELVVFRDSIVSMNKRLEDILEPNLVKKHGRKTTQHITNFSDIVTKLADCTDHKREDLTKVLKDIVERLLNRWIIQDPISIHVATDPDSDEYFLLVKNIQRINYNLVRYIAELDPIIIGDSIELIDNDNVPVLFIKILKKNSDIHKK